MINCILLKISINKLYVTITTTVKFIKKAQKMIYICVLLDDKKFTEAL